MSARLKATIAALSALSVCIAIADLATAVGAGNAGSSTTTPSDGGQPATTVVRILGPTMEINIGLPGSEGSIERTASGSAATAPRCTYTPARTISIGEENVDDYVSHRVAGAVPPQYVAQPGAGTETYMIRSCPGQGTAGMWITSPEGVDIQVLIDSVYESARASVPMPSSAISPPASQGTAVNFGMWLAVTDPGQVNAFAQVGPVWVSLTATYTDTTFDMGNGDVVDCAGFGTPYPDGADTSEQGPCGYTYEAANDGYAPYTLTVSGRWNVQITASDGRNEALAPIDTTTTMQYPVTELITVGQS